MSTLSWALLFLPCTIDQVTPVTSLVNAKLSQWVLDVDGMVKALHYDAILM